MTKNPRWKQLTPADQLVGLLQAVEGHLLNIKQYLFMKKWNDAAGVSALPSQDPAAPPSALDRSEENLSQALKFIEEIKQLQPFLQQGHW
jgi:hypothetical protein